MQCAGSKSGGFVGDDPERSVEYDRHNHCNRELCDALRMYRRAEKQGDFILGSKDQQCLQFRLASLLVKWSHWTTHAPYRLHCESI